jgi:hypothetical protein
VISKPVPLPDAGRVAKGPRLPGQRGPAPHMASGGERKAAGGGATIEPGPGLVQAGLQL